MTWRRNGDRDEDLFPVLLKFNRISGQAAFPCFLRRCVTRATSAYSKLYNECVTIKPVPLTKTNPNSSVMLFLVSKICRLFASSGVDPTSMPDCRATISRHHSALSHYLFMLHELELHPARSRVEPGSQHCLPSSSRVGSILGQLLALNCWSCTDVAFIYGFLNESHIYYTLTLD